MKRHKYIRGLLSACDKYALLGLTDKAATAEESLQEGMFRLRYANEFGAVADARFNSKLAIRAVVIGQGYLRIYLSLTATYHGSGMVFCVDLQGDAPTVEVVYHDRVPGYQSPNHTGVADDHVGAVQQMILNWLNKNISK